MNSDKIKAKFTWEVKHSFIYFVTLLVEDKKYVKLVCSYL
jgi:hypothetical protein